MFVKRYIAKDMALAMERIRRDLGPDAVILSNRPVRKKGFMGFFQKKLVEVMVAYEPGGSKSAPENNSAQDKKAEPPAAPAAPAPAPAQELATDKLDALSQTLLEMKAEIASLSARVESAGTVEPEAPALSALDEARGVLAGQGAEDAVLDSLLAGLEKDAGIEAIRECLGKSLCCDPPFELREHQQNVIIFLGPTGVGKTTTLVKMAGMYAIGRSLKVGLINTDIYRVAAQEQLKTYSEILEIPCLTVYSPAEMESALMALQDRDLVLIDTAGKSTGATEYHEEISAYIKQSGVNEIFLAVNASMSPLASREIIDNYAFLKDYKLIITKLDEVSAWGNVLNIAHYAQRPPSFITFGQNVPQDIELADSAKILDKLFEREDA